MTSSTDPTRRRRVQPGIYKKANGRFIVRYRDGDRVRDRTFDTLRDARRFKVDRELDRPQIAGGAVGDLQRRVDDLEQRLAALEAR